MGEQQEKTAVHGFAGVRATLERQSELAAKLRRDLELRLEELHKAPAVRKIEMARYILAAVFELLHAQAGFNAAVLAGVIATEEAYNATARSLAEQSRALEELRG